VSGFLVDDVSEASAAARRIVELDRTQVRAAFERRFDIERTAREYVQIYRGLVRAEETCRNEKSDAVTQSFIPRVQRGYQPILTELGVEVPNAAQAD
jgi:hypothetical protein